MRSSSREDLRKLWADLKIGPGDLVMCHSFVGALGQIEGGVPSIIETLQEAVGPEGHLVFPTFTYSYFDNEVFDWNESPSTVGILGDIARQTPGAVRSLDPVFSMVCLGPNAEALMARNSIYSFGEDSIYGKLHRANCKILLLGVNFTAMSLFMHLERLLGVPYRYDKKFSGRTRKDGVLYEDEAVHYVRDMTIDFDNDRTEIGQILEADSRCHSARLGYKKHLCMASHAIAEIVKKQFDLNPYNLVRYPAHQHNK